MSLIMTGSGRRLLWFGAFASAAILVPASVAAQRHDEQLWLQVNTNLPLADDVRLTLEQIARFSERQEGLYQTELGGILGYRVKKNVELGFGYRRVDTHNANTAGGEHRVRQHIIATFGPVTTRLRVDQRFSSGGPEIGFRIRPLIRYNHRLTDNGPVLFVSHESIFLPNSTKWGQKRGYERMRNIVGATVPIGRHANADVGYLNQYRFARDNQRGQMDHAISIQLTIDLAAVARRRP